MKQHESYDPKLVALAREMTKQVNPEPNIASLNQLLARLTVETAHDAEMEKHLGYSCLNVAI